MKVKSPQCRVVIDVDDSLTGFTPLICEECGGLVPIVLYDLDLSGPSQSDK